jgi:CDP-diglyceride synthetase
MMEENKKTYSTNSAAENIVGGVAATIVGALLVGWFYNNYWKHFTSKQRSFVIMAILFYYPLLLFGTGWLFETILRSIR